MSVRGKILQALKSAVKGEEIPLWHGTKVHPDELAKGAGSFVEPKFSSEFFKSGTGGMTQGPGLYASEEKGVGKRYADLVASYDTSKSMPLIKGEPIVSVIDNLGIENDGVRRYGIDQLRLLQASSEYTGSLLGGNDYTFINDKRDILGQIKRMKEVVGKNPDSTISIDDLSKLEELISGLKKRDFGVSRERYLYRVAFPNERYIDWHNPDVGSGDIFDRAVKLYGIAPLEEEPVHSGRDTIQILGNRLFNKYVQENADEFAKVAESAQNFDGFVAVNAMDAQLRKKGDELVRKQIVDAFEKAGFAGTKYRGDQQKGDYFNYVLMKPERARVLDVFKFGIGGGSLLPILSQPSTQTED